jgi:MYXO-CTERM domain-containing protein
MANGASSNNIGYGDNAYGGSNGHGAWLSGGTGDLTNGVLGGDIGSDARNWVPYVLWLNFNPTITFDLGSTQAVNQLDAHFLAFGRAGVYLPGAAALRFSLDGSSYFGQTLVDFDHAPVASSEQRWLSLQTTTQQARYVQVEWLRDSGRPWMALSEVSLSYNAPATAQGVPEPASTALALAALGALAATRRRRPA